MIGCKRLESPLTVTWVVVVAVLVYGLDMGLLTAFAGDTDAQEDAIPLDPELLDDILFIDPSDEESLSFIGWDKWPTEFKNCNPKHNPNMSPIDISTADMITLRNVPAMRIYSGKPLKHTYTFGTLFTMDGVQMEALSIRAKSDESVRDSSYITLAGEQTARYFENGFLLFTAADTSESERQGRRLHTIDGKRYPMEVILNFKTKVTFAITQLHILVELTDYVNPIWRPLLDQQEALITNIINDKCYLNHMRKEKTEELLVAQNIYNRALYLQKQETNGSTYEEMYRELEETYKTLKDCDAAGMQKLRDDILTANQTQTKCHDGLVPFQATVQSQRDIVKELQSALNMLKQNEKPYAKEEELLANSMSELKKLEAQEAEMFKCIVDNAAKQKSLKELRKERKMMLRDFRVGNDSTDVFGSVGDIRDTVVKLNESQHSFALIRDNYEMLVNEMDNFKGTAIRSSALDDMFQISWLLPETGGYYYYNGSSPIPPCKNRAFVAVFEKPLTINNEYLEAFRSILSIHQTDYNAWTPLCDPEVRGDQELGDFVGVMDKVDNQVSIAVPLGKRKVHFNPKNLQFLKDDTVHMNSIQRKRAKLKLMKGK